MKVLAACQTLTAPVALVSVTGPGKDVLPWDPRTGKVERIAAMHWNGTAPERWSVLHHAAMAAVRRSYGGRAAPTALLVKVWEYQKRGVLHLHLVLPFGTPVERLAAHTYVAALARLAPANGFGYVDRGKLPFKGARQSSRRLEPVAAHRAAAYVAGYVVSTGAGKEGVSEVARKQGVPGAVVYVAPRLLHLTGVSMRSLRLRRTIASAFPGSGETPQTWRAACLVHALSRRRAPLTRATRETLYGAALYGSWADVIDTADGRWISPTRAAAPAAVMAAVQTDAGPRRTGRVRLDSVLHGSHEVSGRWTRWTEVRELGGALG